MKKNFVIDCNLLLAHRFSELLNMKEFGALINKWNNLEN